ncbi:MULTISPECIES: LacI family DNA-binding transcriptional regulator [unclassified Microbacterium]|uniref:LacI family DNA-binding transcriptional regulator n=1 Tax=unclassified Microbacterium TaxID=2609290 RepID=UPI0025F13035|nr:MULTISPECIES: LacI family DNA-binding transcriptional regulator [unclassified Microbacterium]
MRFHATRADVARRAGVSTAVVSYVVNGGPRPVASTTRERVLEAMRDLDYRPNAVARALSLRRSNAVGLIVPDVGNTYFGALARELSDQAFTAGYALVLGDSSNSIDRERAQIESLASHQIDGLIVVSLDPDSAVDVGGIPIVYLDQRRQTQQRSIVIDNEGGARLAVEHLLWHGRRRVAHLGGIPGSPGADRRRAGWEYALRSARVPLEPDMLITTEFSRAAGYAAGGTLLDGENRPDAVFVASDVQALGLLAAARERGIRVPEDLAVISFDGTEDAVYSDPPLTAIEQPIAEIARKALQTTLDPASEIDDARIPVRLVIRASCGCGAMGSPRGGN